jgi:hypothetical protein|uniref:Uncharacterized protein n=1 Tax=Myoviridae sp. ctshb19 TaxID=2825194 RepID=A0A8S5UGV2_9CAUD|nr:MAG TPA: hypothetical protein [Myoviridae sp. ctshb19]
MEQFKFPECCVGGLENECRAKVERDGDLAVFVMKAGKPHARIAVDIVDSVGVTVQAMHAGAWQPFYESKRTLEDAQANYAQQYNQFFFDGFPVTFAELTEDQRAHVYRCESESEIDFLMDQVSAIVASALFSKNPTMEINVDGYPEVMNRAMLEALNIDTKDADGQLKGLIDCHGNPIKKKKKKGK